MLDPVYTFERFIYPFTRAKPDYFPLSALDIHHKAPACQSSVQSGSVLFTTSFSHMLQATGGWWQCVGCGDWQVSCVPQPPLSVKSADSTEAVTWSWRDWWERGRVCSSRVGSGGQQVPFDPQSCFTLLLMSLFLSRFSFKAGRLASPLRPLELALSRGSLAPGSPLTWRSFSREPSAWSPSGLKC